MLWYQLRIENCHRDKVELLSDELEEQGAVSVMLTDKNDDPILEPAPGSTPLWPEVVIEALYTEEGLANHAKKFLLEQHPETLCTMALLPDEDWVRASMENFKPQQFGERLWICPTWSTPPDPEAVNLMLDPGLAFGTGTHPTTSLCLTWLAETNLDNKQVIDYGCGSGILAIAALKLGAAHVQAIDIDPQALHATENNASLNHLDSKQLALGFPDRLEAQQDLIIANILLTPLLSLVDRFYELLNPQGSVVVSGLLKEQTPTLIDAYQSRFRHINTKIMGDWALVEFSRL
jgi:ribosomal protein L11 methyltransferase